MAKSENYTIFKDEIEYTAQEILKNFEEGSSGKLPNYNFIESMLNFLVRN